MILKIADAEGMCMKKTAYCLLSLFLLAACASENSKPSKTSNPYYHVEKVKTDTGEELDKTIISGPPTPPKGYDRPVVIPPDTTGKKEDKAIPETHSMPGK